MLRLPNIFVLVGLSGLLTACQPPNGIKEVKYPWTPQVEQTTHFGEIEVAPSVHHSQSNDKVILKGLLGRLSSSKDTYGRLIACEPGNLEDKHILKTRLKQVSNELKNLGILEKNITVTLLKPQRAPSLKSGTITVVLKQYEAFAPDCPGWGSMPESEPGGDRNFGCATAANLAHMIANPKELIEGQALEGGNPTLNSLMIDRYETDTITELKVEKVNAEQTE